MVALRCAFENWVMKISQSLSMCLYVADRSKITVIVISDLIQGALVQILSLRKTAGKVKRLNETLGEKT